MLIPFEHQHDCFLIDSQEAPLSPSRSWVGAGETLSYPYAIAPQFFVPCLTFGTPLSLLGGISSPAIFLRFPPALVLPWLAKASTDGSKKCSRNFARTWHIRSSLQPLRPAMFKSSPRLDRPLRRRLSYASSPPLLYLKKACSPFPTSVKTRPICCSGPESDCVPHEFRGELVLPPSPPG